MAFNTLTYSILQSPFLIFVFVLICSVFFCFNKSKNSSSSSNSSIVLICTVLVTTKVRYIRKSSVGETKWWAISIHERLAVSELKYLCCLAMHTFHKIKYIYIYFLFIVQKVLVHGLLFYCSLGLFCFQRTTGRRWFVQRSHENNKKN